MTLMLHTGAEPVDYDTLRMLPVPEATATHCPIAHAAVADMVKFALQFHGHEIVQEDYGVTPDGARFFGVLSLKSEYGDYCDQVGLRNSHDKKFPIGISFGARVFVCDNLSFNGDRVIKRKHTANAKRELPSIVAEVVEPLKQQRIFQAQTFEGYRQRMLTDAEVDHAIMQLYRQGAINVTRIADVIQAYETPPYDWGDKNCWRLFNAVTLALAGKVAENPRATRQLHEVIDGFCEPAPLMLPAPVLQ